MAIGDKFPRHELIRAILEPSAEIAVGYGTTTVETVAEEEFQGVIKDSTPEELMLMGADGKYTRIAKRDIKSQRGSNVSLMPEGLQAAMSPQEFADLIEYLTTLRQPESALTSNRGMPRDIPESAKPIGVRPFFSEDLRFPHAFVNRPGDVRYGLVWFGQVPGRKDFFLVVHQTGRIWLLEKEGTNTIKTLFADLTQDVFSKRGPNGLLGLAFHPKLGQNRKYYLKHQVFEEGRICTVVVERVMSAGLRSDSGQPSRRLWKAISTTQDHSGGCIAFGPDGFLYIGMGDTGPQEDPQGHGQDLSTQLGKMLRIDVDHTSPGREYAIPGDNPFRGIAGACPEIWAYGFREPWRFSFDSTTGDLWVGDVGQDRVEEVGIVRRGENHGWNVYEGFEPFSNRYRKEGSNYIAPVFAYHRKYGNSITGGYVYRGDKDSPFYGVYVCGDYTSHRIFGIKQKDRQLQVVRQIGAAPQGIASFGEDEAGNLYVVGYEGMIYKLDFSHAVFEAGPGVASEATP
jgi:putative heme-binding domain-containing protein